jgi:hypothetical protein
VVSVKLPIEILLNIAGFIAGNNDYGTLLAFCMASKQIQEETKSTFYETVLEPDTKYLLSKPGARLGLDAYRFTKYVLPPVTGTLKFTLVG